MKDAIDRLRALTAEASVSDLCNRVKNVVIVGSSSRGGSSVSMEMLRHSRSLIHFRGEINPFLALAGLTHPHAGTGSDKLTAEHATDATCSILSAAMARDAGQPCAWPTSQAEVQRLARDAHWRLLGQWPHNDFTMEQIATAVVAALDPAEAGAMPTHASITAFQIQLIAQLPRISPWFYDLDPTAIHASMPETSEPTTAPGPSIIEEPPFVLTQPWCAATADQLDHLPLVIKTPSNAYRLPFLRALFPNARVRVLHLTRNPAASINGLVDGWRFRGFHAHRLEGGHSIDGANDTDWWKYDLPPGWEAWTQKSLVEVAGFQWRSAHAAILKDRGEDFLQVRFEDLVGPRRKEFFSTIFDWIGVDLDPPMAAIVSAGLPPVMATERPRQRRWFARAKMLEPVLQDPDVRQITEALGYIDREQWL